MSISSNTCDGQTVASTSEALQILCELNDLQLKKENLQQRIAVTSSPSVPSRFDCVHAWSGIASLRPRASDWVRESVWVSKEVNVMWSERTSCYTQWSAA